jgi:hypothetical protein
MALKNIIILVMSLFIVGCGTTKTITEYRDVRTPVYIIPKPPKESRPELAIEQVTPQQKDDLGELAKAYKLSVKQLQQYVERLEKIIDTYDKNSGEHDTKPKLFDSDK